MMALEGQGHSHDCRDLGRGGGGVVLHEAWDVTAPRHALRLRAAPESFGIYGRGSSADLSCTMAHHGADCFSSKPRRSGSKLYFWECGDEQEEEEGGGQPRPSHYLRKSVCLPPAPVAP